MTLRWSVSNTAVSDLHKDGITIVRIYKHIKIWAENFRVFSPVYINRSCRADCLTDTAGNAVLADDILRCDKAPVPLRIGIPEISANPITDRTVRSPFKSCTPQYSDR